MELLLLTYSELCTILDNYILRECVYDDCYLLIEEFRFTSKPCAEKNWVDPK